MKTYSDFLHDNGEKKWQASWEEKGLYKTPENITPENKMYILPQLPYPSGSGLHVGHAEVYTACDIYARYQRMMGKDVLQVIGWDSFGLPAENYAIKTNVHPRVSTDKAIENFREQIELLGISVDWEKEVGAHNADYYKWTQWFFLLMYKRGLAYRKMQAVNWCESCKTVLANDQVKEGKCERCDTLVIQKEMEQWYIKITDYADKLLEGLDRIDWPEETKKRQKNWIGKSEGAEIDFRIKNYELGITVFTTRPDTLFGATYMVLAPEHELVKNLKSEIKNWSEVEAYIDATAKKTDLDRQIDQEKTGVELKGIVAINPANNKEIPVWIADYVLASYGTGAIMAVPAHDERDFAFAKKFKLPIEFVIQPGVRYSIDLSRISLEAVDKVIEKHYIYGVGLLIKDENYELCAPDVSIAYQPLKEMNQKNGNTFSDDRVFHSEDEPYLGVGTLKDSGNYSNLFCGIALPKMAEKYGKYQIQYKLRDWSVSRQRFWGAPIPVISNQEEKNKKRQFVLIHGFQGTATSNYFPALTTYLEAEGHTVIAPDLPNSDAPNLDEQVEAILSQVKLDADTVLLGHSLGAPVVLKLLAKAKQEVAKVILSDGFYIPTFNDTARPAVEESTDWSTVAPAVVKQFAREWVVVADNAYPIIPKEHSEKMAEILDARLVFAPASKPHFNGLVEEIFEEEVPVTGLIALSVEALPVILPDDVDFKPTGQSPLTYSESFHAGVEEIYGKGWKREVDTLDTFMCSSWFYYRYLDPKNEDAFASPEALKKWMPVDFYLGGEEHVNGHLLYARFFTKVLHDAGYIDFDEPFKKHRHQGLILGEDSRKMSKRWGNVVNPTDVVNEYGADTCRMYEMFMGPLEEAKPWNIGGVKGIKRFLDRVWGVKNKVIFREETGNKKLEIDGAAEVLLHKIIKKVSDDTATLQFNTAIAKMMELVNAWSKAEYVLQDHFEIFLRLLAPYAPHMAEELWAGLGHTDSVTTQPWPTYDEALLVEDTITLAVQVNGKLRATLEVAADISEEDVKVLALGHENVLKWVEGKEVRKVIYVKGRLVSVVV
jgi:leucyl-tRNA synthetase/predicted alpha/beta hydrolase family esterase